MLLTLANLGLDLCTNGFCKPQEQEEGSDEGEGEGTGMGQGQGREDVSEEIENEGQMEGLQGEENKDPQVSLPPKFCMKSGFLQRIKLVGVSLLFCSRNGTPRAEASKWSR
jgi:hypothetical protein